MPPLRLTEEDAAALRAVILLQRYTQGLNQLTDRWLGDQGTDNTDLRILLAVREHDGAGPSDLVAAIGMPRSTVARGLARLLQREFVERRTQPADRRRAALHLTPGGRTGIAHFERSLADHFREGEPLVKEVLLLLGGDPERGDGTGPEPLGVLQVAGLMSAAGAAYARDLEPRMRAVEGVDRFALMVLAQGWARPTWLADELGLSPAGITSMLERMEAAGLVVRESGGLGSDRRAVVVHLTPRGRRAARTLLAVFRKHQGSFAEALAPTLGFACS